MKVYIKPQLTSENILHLPNKAFWKKKCEKVSVVLQEVENEVKPIKSKHQAYELRNMVAREDQVSEC